MRTLPIATVLLSLFVPLATAAQSPPSSEPGELARAFGDLPKSGNLADVLRCAGANEVFWTPAMMENPRNPEAHEAKRKAGWYSAVALWVFEVDSAAVISAVESASERESTTVFELASRCRKAPDNWRE